MKRYLLINVGYQQLAIPCNDGERMASIVAALAEAQAVESKGYGDDQRWIPSSKEPLQMQFIDGSKITIGDDLATLKAQLEDVTRQQATYSKHWTDERAKTSRLEKELAALKAAAIPPPPQTSEPAPEAVRDDEMAF